MVLWDFETRGVAAVLRGGHEREVAALAWAHDGHRLVTADLGGALRVWGVLAGAPEASAQLAGKPVRARARSREKPASLAARSAPPRRADRAAAAAPAAGAQVSVQLHPRAPHLVLACCAGEPAALLDVRSGALTPLPFGVPAADAGATGGGAPAGRKAAATAGAAAAGALASTGVAVFSRRADAVFIGSSQGTLAAVDADGGAAVRACVKLGSGAAVRALSLSRDGRVLLALCGDRTLRTVDAAAPGLRALREFRDAVDRTLWCAAALSGDREFVGAAATGGPAEHVLHVWSGACGALECVLEGPPDAGAAKALAWHPAAPLLVTLGAAGRLYVWARTAPENWSAFAPDFRELEENEEYAEREDEFDAPAAGGAPGAPGPAPDAAADGGAAYAEPVDVLAPHPALAAAESDSEEPGALHHLPLAPERDVPPQAQHVQPGAEPAPPPAAERDAHAGDEQQAAKKPRA